MCQQTFRFGKYTLDMNNLPGPLDPQPLPFEAAKQAEQADSCRAAGVVAHPAAPRVDAADMGGASARPRLAAP